MNPDEQSIRKLVDTWMQASQTGDLAAVLDLMTEDVVFLVPGEQPFGKDRFTASFEKMKGLRFEGRSDIEELQVLGDFAYLRNKIEITISSADGHPVHRAGRTLTILRKGADGQWRIARDANLVIAVPV